MRRAFGPDVRLTPSLLHVSFASVVGFASVACSTDGDILEPPTKDVGRQRVASPGGYGSARVDAGDVRYLDTHDHFAHTTVVERSKLPYFEKREAAREIALTFDCAWVPEEAGMAVLDALREVGVKSTFFVSGPFVFSTVPSRGIANDATLRMARRIVEDGHEVGNHTHTHPHASASVGWARELTDLKAGWDTQVARAFPGIVPPRTPR